jgi:hypothetical protein
MRFSNHLEIGLLVVAIIAGVIFAEGVARGEAAGCANATCKMILYHYDCNFMQGYVTDNTDCFHCSQPDGRCNNGANVPCNSSDTPLNFASTTVTRVCDCGQGVPASTIVEASGNYTGTYQPYGTRYTCPGTTIVSGAQ